MSQQVNLYHPIFRRQQKKFSARTMAQASAIIAAGAVVLVGLNLWRAWTLERELENAEQRWSAAVQQLEQVARETPRPEKHSDLAAEVDKLETILRASQQTQEILQHADTGPARGFSVYLAALARQTIAGVRLTDIEIHGTDRQLVLRGQTNQEANVMRFLQRLSSETVLAGFEFPHFDLIRPEPIDPKTGKTLPPAEYLEFEIKTQPRPATKS